MPWHPSDVSDESNPGHLLAKLAQLYGIQTTYTSSGRYRVRARRESLLAALSALGAPITGTPDLVEAYRLRRQRLWTRLLEPVMVAWEGRPLEVHLRFPARMSAVPVRVEAVLEDGTSVTLLDGSVEPHLPVEATEAESVEGIEYQRSVISVPNRLPLGYHSLRVSLGKLEASSLLIAAPTRATEASGRTWGVFLPLYALRTRRDWGTGDLTDLEALAEWTGSLGGDMVATLPLLAAFLDRPFEPSPYSPASRLFWNELYLDPTRAPEFRRSPEARRVLGSRRFQEELDDLRTGRLVDYRLASGAKRRVLELLAPLVESPESPRREQLDRYARQNPRLDDYARFRAALERHGGTPWTTWPRRERDGHLPRDGGNPTAHRYHRYVQWLAAEQMEATARAAVAKGAGLYFDLPLGVHPDGYDAWRERDAFVSKASAGSPPDRFFAGGQNWGFPPLHPDGIREQGYRYYRDSIRHLFRHASVARIDHVMGLHRIYVVPHGLTSGDGVYVRYRAQELHAILTLESRRHGTVVVGEDLGTVPAKVRTAMRRLGILRSYVLQFELRPQSRRAVRRPPPDSMAALDTHDLPAFAAFWRGLDIRERLRAGWIDAPYAARELKERDRVRVAVVAYLRAHGWLQPGSDPPSDSKVLRALLSALSASDSAMVVANLEDLWLETRPQNVPGTVDRYPNWRRRARFSLEELSGKRSVTGLLREVARLREAGDMKP
jgi:4-alpha-glucanotransferase